MYVSRYLKPEYVKLGLRNGHPDQIDPERDLLTERKRLKGEVIDELSELFLRTGQIRNPVKFRKDLGYRESSSTTAVGNGMAVPHCRSKQPRKVALIFARSRDGVEYLAPDDKRVHIFFGIVAPPWDDKVFLHFYKWIAQSFLQEDWLPGALLEAEDEHEIIGILSGLQ